MLRSDGSKKAHQSRFEGDSRNETIIIFDNIACVDLWTDQNFRRNNLGAGQPQNVSISA